MAQSVVGRTTIQGATTVGGFNPASLFASGEVGAWYDPSDMTTMYSAVAGTIDGFVTTLESPISVIMDKSKTLFATTGAELVSNPGPNFTVTTGWSAYAGGSAAVSSGKLRVTTVNAFSGVQTSITTVIGKIYKVTASASLVSGTGAVRMYKSDDAVFTINTATLVTASPANSFFVATAATTYLTVVSNIATTVYDWDYISVKEVQGNSASQNTAANRPVLSARVNLLTYSQQFDNAYWSKFQSTVTADQIIAPDGTLTADLLTTTSTSGTVSAAALSAGTFDISIYAKAGTGTSFAIYDAAGGNGRKASFTLSGDGSTSGVSVVGTGGTSSGGSASITSVGNGWYRCVFSGVTNSVGIRPIFECANNLATVYIWGADLRPANQGVGLPPYQRVGAATYGTGTTAGVADYDANGFPYYLKFDGAASALATASIDFTGTNKSSLWAGIRNLQTNIASGIIAELSASSATNNGTFAATYNLNTNYALAYRSRGTTTITAETAGGYIGPVSAILAGTGDIAAPSCILRVNGVQAVSNSGSQGTGNYGNYPIYIGARAGTSTWFNGYIYGLIIRGASSTANQITATENWLNQKTKAF